MTAPVTMPAADYAVEVFKRTRRADDVGQWERADAVAAAIDAEIEKAGDPLPSHHDGSYAAIERLASRLTDAGVSGVQIKTIADYRNVAQAWPGEERVARASYDAHRELRAKTWDGKRRSVLLGLVERNRNPKAIVTGNDVRIFKAEQKPAKPVSWDQRFEKQLRRVFRSKDRPQAPGEWQTAVHVLEALLDEARHHQ